MPSAWINAYRTRTGKQRYRVRYRLGGRETFPLHGGSFKTKREAGIRCSWIDGELAAMRVPDLSLVQEAPAVETLSIVAERWRTSRLDVSGATAQTHRVNLARILPRLGARPVDSIRPVDVAQLVVALHADGEGLARESIRKTIATLAMALDFAGVTPNPARDKSVKLPRRDDKELTPPTAGHLLAVYPLMPRMYRLALLVLDATGMRVGELEGLLWGDVDEPASRWRVRKEVVKTGRGRWIPIASFPAAPLELFETVVALVPREDRDLSAQVLDGFGADRFRTALTRACKAAGVPAFTPHDLRHRRCTLWHLGGVPVAEAAAWAGHSAQEHLRTYAHASLADRSEIAYSDVLVEDRAVSLR